MRILHVMAGAPEGGAENIMLESVLALAEYPNFEQAAVIRPNNEFRTQTLKDAGVDVRTASFNRTWPFPTTAALKKAVRDFKPDIIEYWMGRAGQFALASERVRSIGWYGGYYKLVRFKNCQWHIGLTKDLCDHIHGQGVAREHIGLVHTMADFKDAKPTDRASLDTPKDAPVALALARLHVKKGLDTLLEATALVPGLYVWIAGDGPIEAELKTQCTKLGLDDRVRFLGWRNDRAELLAACDLVAFPSRYEPFGTVTVDAWAAKRALVAANAKGPAAYVKNGVNGLLIPKDNVEALRNAMQRLIDDKDLREMIVAGGWADYQDQFTAKAFVRDSKAFYQKIIAAQT